MAHLSQRQTVGAIFAPAVQPIFSSNVCKDQHRFRSFGDTGIQVKDLNFLQAGKVFNLDVFLTSAHVYRDVKGVDITHTRRPDQVHIVDSGGYSVINSTIKADQEFARKMWEYQVKHADVALTLDVPLGTIEAGKNPHYRTFNDCLDETVNLLTHYSTWNNGLGLGQKIRWLNIIQGRNLYESQVWYDRVKGFNFEGWSFAGKSRKDMSTVVSRLFDMKRDGLIRKDAWFHFLGLGSLKAYVALTAIRDGLRQLFNSEEIQVSFDSAYPFNSVSLSRQYYQIDDWRSDTYGFSLQEIPHGLWALGNQDYTGIKGPVLPFMTWDALAYDLRGASMGRRMELGGLKNHLLFQNHNVWSLVTAMANAGDQLKIPRKDRTLPALFSDIYDVIFDVVASGSRHELASNFYKLAAIVI